MTERKLYRSRSKKVLGGVCGGLADFFSLDVTIVRLIWAVASLLWGAGIIIYIICLIIIPNEPDYNIS